MIRITVPATSANLGCGFDTLGIALNLYASFTFDVTENGLVISGCDHEYANKDNLVYQSFKTVYDKIEVNVPGLSIHIDSSIPLARGLGSSAACIIAGVTAANYFLGNPFNTEELFQIASDIEGHPDNIAPCMFGGFQASTNFQNKWIHESFNVHESLKFYACIPDFKLSTKKSRDALPDTLSYKQTVSNLSKIAFLIKGLQEGHDDYLKLGFNDSIHQPYRFPLIENSQCIISWCKDKQLPYYLSGAGPTIMIVSKKHIDFNELGSQLKHSWNIIPFSVSMKGVILNEQ